MKNSIQILVVFSIVFYQSCNVNRKSFLHEQKCDCSTIVKTYLAMEDQIKREGYNYFSPKKPAAFFADGTHSEPILNEHIQLIKTCTDIEFDEPSKQFNYYVNKEKLGEIYNWIHENCEND
jgi:hypothetical protein